LELAATYAVGIARNHPFVDGNKRMAFMALGLFLADDGRALGASEEEATSMMLEVAAGSADIPRLVAWLVEVTDPA
jgi:death-on-curing protein